MTSAKYTLRFFLFSALLLIGIGIFNWSIDPLYLFRSPTIAGTNELRTEFFNYQLLSKPYALADYNADTLFLGSSRTGTSFRPQHEAFAGDRPYNGALAGSTLRANIMHYRHAMAAQPLKRVVISPDFYMFNAYQRPSNPGAYREFEQRLLVHDDGSTNYKRLAKLIGDYLDTLLSWNTLKASVRTVTQQQAVLAGDAPFLTIHPDGHWTNRVAENRSHSDYFKQVERIYIPNGWVPAGNPRFEFTFDEPGQTAPIDDFRWFLRDAYQNNVDVKIVFMPYHARLLEAMHLIGVWQRSEEWKRLMVSTVEEVAREMGEEPFPIWDFTGYNTVNMDPLPDRQATGNQMRWYRDSSHVQQHTADLILDRVMGYEHAGRHIPSDFGVRIDSNNIEDQIERINSQRAVFLRDYPDAVNDIERMVDKANARDVVN